ncbi:MAG: family 14 glycosylhydrolase [Candidatus Solibacter usitatus]|nr:family 14 glycosylhydrolase [Candidatus Solibacter usitatus]
MRLTLSATVLSVLAAAACPAAELGRWDAAQPAKAQGIRLERAVDSPWRIEPQAGAAVARLTPSADYYTRTAYLLSLEKAAPGKVWLVLEFLDRGYGLINLSPGLAETRQWGVARVNSGRVRRAVFQFDKAPPARIRVEGLDYLRAATLSDQQPALEPAPLVDPAVRFTIHSERVSTASGDSASPDHIADALAGLRNQLPLVRAMGFNGVETYVRWGYVERTRGAYDWRYYDAILDEIEKHGLQWFPMLLAGSGYALPAWLHDSKDNIGFECLEHGIKHDTQTIFHPFQTEYASRFIAEFGRHYRQRKSLLGIRLGPSGDYGEAQYPAKGPGYGFKESHTHIGYWAADPHAKADFRRYLQKQYGEIAKLNAAWSGKFESFDQVQTFLPETALTRRQRIDFADWYMGAMSDWCEKWAIWSRQALPETSIHQSSGGWGPVQIGTDYSYQARSMSKVHGGIRLTNEGDDFPDNFTITRMANSAARFYGIPTGYEPGGFGSKRGVMARLYNAVTTGAVHLFYYLGNLTSNDQSIDAWLRHSKLLDQRAKPLIDVAAFYPDTALKLDDEVVRYRWGSIYFSVARTLREQLDFDYASEQMILDGALPRYKVLLFLWGSVTERPVLERIDAWVRNGGTLVFAPRPRGIPTTVEGDTSIARRWLEGDTGKGRVIQWHGDLVPARSYSTFVRDLVLKTPGVQPAIRAALEMRKPDSVFWSVLENGKLMLLNFGDDAATVRLASGKSLTIPPYEIAVE